MDKFKTYNNFNLSEINRSMLEYWNQFKIFEKSITNRSDSKPFIFYEGPPSANGMPGIHHVIARTIKDMFCRYKTLKGFNVERKAGWDTHGLPVELGVEKLLGITKEDIGKTISIAKYNAACRKNVMKYKGSWEDITEQMGYWVDMDSPYVTYDNKYIESVWWLLKKLYKKKALYKGHTIQPFSPKAGTGLSTHELNQPGCYRNVKDTTLIAQFQLKNNKNSGFLYQKTDLDIFLIAWTTTPWTLPSNTALAVGKKIDYVLIETFNKYNAKPIAVILAKELINKHFDVLMSIKESYSAGDKELPYKILFEFKGELLQGLKYEQLFKYAIPDDGEAFKILLGDFVTTDDGTGVVHVAPSFGSEDNLLAKKNNIGSLTLVNTQGKFKDVVVDFAGMYVKEEYYTHEEKKPDLSVDIQIAIKLKERGLCFNTEKYDHSYPHCWRTDMPILYYPMDSWFVKTTDYKKRMLDLNNQITWKPSSTGEGRFGNWLENLVDWNLSRSRFWGIPIPIWQTEDGEEEVCIGSVEELKKEIEKSIKFGHMTKNPLENFIVNDFSEKNYMCFDLHRPYVDDIVLTSKKGAPMKRELDLIDVWFDSGSMPYAQLHYPFENKALFEKMYPADFIAEGVDQTRGWFFTLHAISTILFDNFAYKTVISNGLVLDKEGNKMSKRLGNAVDPFKIIEKYGADATRWYMIVNSQPWENLKFNELGIQEVQRKFFGTLFNTYSFFSLYANIDSFKYKEVKINVENRAEIDQWIISELNSLIKGVGENFDKYESNKVARLIQDFVVTKLSNWYVRLSRRRFWKGEYNKDKISAYQTLYECLEKIAIISSPIAPFFMDNLFRDLNLVSKMREEINSVHMADFPNYNDDLINLSLEKRMNLAQNITSLCLSLRKKKGIRVRQPLEKIMIPVLDDEMVKNIKAVEDIIKNEVNVKNIKYLTKQDNVLKREIKPNFKSLGPKFGNNMKIISDKIKSFGEKDIQSIQRDKKYKITNDITIELTDVEINTIDIPGYTVANNEGITVALDINISEKLKNEGLAREFINRVQNHRKENLFNVTDKIEISILNDNGIQNIFKNNLTYICNETLAETIVFTDKPNNSFISFKLIESVVKVNIKKINDA